MSELTPEEQAAKDTAAAEEANASAEKDARISELEAQVQALQADAGQSPEKDAQIAELQQALDAAKLEASNQTANAASNVATAPQPVLAEKNPSPGLDVGQAEVQARVDAEQAQGFRGQNVDPTPNENYSMQTPPDAPTPETDPALAAAAKAAVDGNRLVNTDQTTTETAVHNAENGGS